jgi:triphosphoribosyl-dephospho-CoA synthetase
MAWTYDSALSTDTDRLRFLVGDTLSTDQQFQDAELEYLIEAHGTLYAAAAAACRSLASKYARYADKWVGDLKILASQKSRAYAALAETFETKAVGASTWAIPTAGGVYTADKAEQEANTALEQGTFKRGMHDNLE